ncbi:hypothetical protein IAT40_000346 [Kwoniella sp. CBS 6097]
MAPRGLTFLPWLLLIAAILIKDDRQVKLDTVLRTFGLKSGYVDLHEQHEHLCKHALAAHENQKSPVSCPVQPSSLNIGPEWDPASDDAFRKLSHERLAGAIQIRTESFDDMPLDASDPRFESFTQLETYLRKTFPVFHAHLEFARVNEHGLLFSWPGSRPDLQPMLLMAHQDVVPVNPKTWGQWTHPPFSGHLDEDGWVWGRGTTDMKGTLIALLSSTEKLISWGFKPERTILFSFGFDEEIGGERGARELAKVIEKRYGPDGVAIIIDEGFTGVDEEYGTTFARLGRAEKGCLTVTISISAPGGHSSRPPKNTAVGVMSRLLVEMENNPTGPKLTEGNPLLTYLECAAEHGTMDRDFRAMIRTEKCWPVLAQRLGQDRILQTFLQTTQAVDIVNGGIKYNALPEYVTSMTNFRIDFFETTQDTFDRLDRLLRPLAAEFNMTYVPVGQHSEISQNVIKLETFGIILEPAPVTPAKGPAWEFMGGTIKHLFPGSVVVPSAMTAFTDTQHFWGVSKHIYRFVPASLEHILNYHTVDERIHMDAHMSTIQFFYKLMRNSIGWESL